MNNYANYLKQHLSFHSSFDVVFHFACIITFTKLDGKHFEMNIDCKFGDCDCFVCFAYAKCCACFSVVYPVFFDLNIEFFFTSGSLQRKTNVNKCLF